MLELNKEKVEIGKMHMTQSQNKATYQIHRNIQPIHSNISNLKLVPDNSVVKDRVQLIKTDETECESKSCKQNISSHCENFDILRVTPVEIKDSVGGHKMTNLEKVEMLDTGRVIFPDQMLGSFSSKVNDFDPDDSKQVKAWEPNKCIGHSITWTLVSKDANKHKSSGKRLSLNRACIREKPLRKMGDACQCKVKYRKCTAIKLKDREFIFSKVRRLSKSERKKFVYLMVERKKALRKYTINNQASDRRNHTLIYYLYVGDTFVRVCKKMFMSTTGLSKHFIERYSRSASSGKRKLPAADFLVNFLVGMNTSESLCLNDTEASQDLPKKMCQSDAIVHIDEESGNNHVSCHENVVDSYLGLKDKGHQRLAKETCFAHQSVQVADQGVKEIYAFNSTLSLDESGGERSDKVVYRDDSMMDLKVNESLYHPDEGVQGVNESLQCLDEGPDENLQEVIANESQHSPDKSLQEIKVKNFQHCVDEDAQAVTRNTTLHYFHVRLQGVKMIESVHSCNESPQDVKVNVSLHCRDENLQDMKWNESQTCLDESTQEVKGYGSQHRSDENLQELKANESQHCSDFNLQEMKVKASQPHLDENLQDVKVNDSLHYCNRDPEELTLNKLLHCSDDREQMKLSECLHHVDESLSDMKVNEFLHCPDEGLEVKVNDNCFTEGTEKANTIESLDHPDKGLEKVKVNESLHSCFKENREKVKGDECPHHHEGVLEKVNVNKSFHHPDEGQEEMKVNESLHCPHDGLKERKVNELLHLSCEELEEIKVNESVNCPNGLKEMKGMNDNLFQSHKGQSSTMGNRCFCRTSYTRCNEISDVEREAIFSSVVNMSTQDRGIFVKSLVVKKGVDVDKTGGLFQRRRHRIFRRNRSAMYFLKRDDECLRVCKKMFLLTTGLELDFVFTHASLEEDDKVIEDFVPHDIDKNRSLAEHEGRSESEFKAFGPQDKVIKTERHFSQESNDKLIVGHEKVKSSEFKGLSLTNAGVKTSQFKKDKVNLTKVANTIPLSTSCVDDCEIYNDIDESMEMNSGNCSDENGIGIQIENVFSLANLFNEWFEPVPQHANYIANNQRNHVEYQSQQKERECIQYRTDFLHSKSVKEQSQITPCIETDKSTYWHDNSFHSKMHLESHHVKNQYLNAGEVKGPRLFLQQEALDMSVKKDKIIQRDEDKVKEKAMQLESNPFYDYEVKIDLCRNMTFQGDVVRNKLINGGEGALGPKNNEEMLGIMEYDAEMFRRNSHEKILKSVKEKEIFKWKNDEKILSLKNDEEMLRMKRTKNNEDMIWHMDGNDGDNTGKRSVGNNHYVPSGNWQRKTRPLKKESWKKEINKGKKREKGERYMYKRYDKASCAYMAEKKTVRFLGDRCHCKTSHVNCKDITEIDRKAIFSKVWSMTWLEREKFVSSSVFKRDPINCSINSVVITRRLSTFHYFFDIRGVRLRVCRTMYLSTTCLNDYFINKYCLKGMLSTDSDTVSDFFATENSNGDYKTYRDNVEASSPLKLLDDKESVFQALQKAVKEDFGEIMKGIAS